MKLGEVLGARDAWQRLSQLKLPPRTAYRLSRYLKTVGADLEAIETQRVKLVREAAGASNGEQVSLNPGTPEHLTFLTQFGGLLDSESELKPLDMKFEEFLNALDGDKANTLSPMDLGALEPFFAVPQ